MALFSSVAVPGVLGTRDGEEVAPLPVKRSKSQFPRTAPLFRGRRSQPNNEGILADLRRRGIINSR